MSHTSDEDKGFSTGIKPDKRCYRCNVPIYFTSKEAETPSGKPTKNVLTGKVIPLDPSTNEYHECKPEDIEAYRETDERKKRLQEYLSTQKSGQEVAGRNTSYTSPVHDTSSSHDVTNNNNSDNNNLTLEKILASINHTNAVLEQVQTDFKADMTAIKNALSIDTDRSSSDAARN
jgi:hypothetical protein